MAASRLFGDLIRDCIGRPRPIQLLRHLAPGAGCSGLSVLVGGGANRRWGAARGASLRGLMAGLGPGSVGCGGGSGGNYALASGWATYQHRADGALPAVSRALKRACPSAAEQVA